MSEIPRLDPIAVQKALSSPPFVVVEGVINIRDVGGYPIQSKPSLVVKPGSIFRSGDLSRITDLGKKQIHALGIKTIFDLRSDLEIQTYKTQPVGIDGVETIRVPVVVQGFDPGNIVATLRKLEEDPTKAFMEDYAKMLEEGAGSFEVIFKHLKDKPDEPCLLHCTAGKDRTGIASAIFLLLLGVSYEDIAKEYALTMIGLEPAHPMLFEHLKKLIPSYQDHLQGIINMGSAKPEMMAAALDMIQVKFGGAEEYFRSYLHMTDDDIFELCQSFLVDSTAAVA